MPAARPTKERKESAKKGKQDGGFRAKHTGVFGHTTRKGSVEEPQNLAAHLLPARFLVVHDAGRRRQHDDAEQAGGEQAGDPVFEVVVGNVVAGGDDAALVEAEGWKKKEKKEKGEFFRCLRKAIYFLV